MKKLIYSLICVRAGSKGLKNKNIKNFLGKPLVYWSIKQSQNVNFIKRTFVSTDSSKIAKICKKYKAEVPYLRKKKLAKDSTPEWLVWRDFLLYLIKKKIKLPEILIILPATSPLRLIQDIKKCIKKFKSRKSDILLTATTANRNPYYNMVEKKKNQFYGVVNSGKNTLHRRQQAKKVFDLCTLAYVTTPNYILKNKNIFSGKVDILEIPKERSIDIDDIYDFDIAKYLFKKK